LLIKINLQVDKLEIIPIFTEQNEGICTIIIGDDGAEELDKIHEQWSDPKYLLAFFTDNKRYLQSGKYENFTINEAVIKTIKDADALFDQLYEIAKNGFTEPQDNLSQLFVPLHKNEVGKLVDYQQCKAYGLKNDNSWLRLYAIRLNSNTFIITGGAIKLVRSMQDAPYLQKELEKLHLTREYLIENGIIDVDDI